MESQGGRWSTIENWIKGPHGAIFILFKKNFQQLPDDDKQCIFDEINHLKTARNIFSKRRNTSATNSEGKDKDIDKMHSEISSFKVKFKEIE